MSESTRSAGFGCPDTTTGPVIGVLVMCCAVVAGCSNDGPHLNQNVGYVDWDDERPPAGNPEGNCGVPDAAMEMDTTMADNVIGDGTPESCTSQAVASGGSCT